MNILWKSDAHKSNMLDMEGRNQPALYKILKRNKSEK